MSSKSKAKKVTDIVEKPIKSTKLPNQIISNIPDNIKNIRELFKNTKKGYEFEFMFFTRKGKFLSQEKYIQLLKFISARSNRDDKLVLSNPIDTLDVIYSEGSDTNVRCSIIGSENISLYMNKLNNMKNHVIFRTLVEYYKRKKSRKYN